jgi:hypothetical protein
MELVSASYCLWQVRQGCRCARYGDPAIKHMKDFLRARIQHVKDNSNIHNLIEIETSFLHQVSQVIEALWLVNSGHGASFRHIIMSAMHGRT